MADINFEIIEELGVTALKLQKALSFFRAAVYRQLMMTLFLQPSKNVEPRPYLMKTTSYRRICSFPVLHTRKSRDSPKAA